MKLTTAVAGAAVALVALAAPAAAHVTVNPSSAAQGSFTALAFRVPNETASTNTVKVDVKLPDDHPLAFVSVKPHSGWTFTTTKAKLATPITTDDGQVTEAVSEITWTATGPGIAPGEYDDFEISVGPLPTDTDSLTFKAIQTYSDGTEVSWIELPGAGGTEPEHPAPVLDLVAGSSDDGHTHDTASTSSGDSSSSSSASGQASGSSDHDSDDDSKGLAVVAIVIGAVGVVLGGLGLARSRPRA
jgi:uncharacterized protein YcnI